MAKEITGHTIQCNLCGGSWGTLVKVGSEHRHARAQDCARHRAIVQDKLKREEILKQIKK